MSFPIVLLLALLPQAAQSAPAKDALALLNEVSQRYADAKSYHIEAVEESTTSNEWSRDWEKTLVTAIVMPGGRYRYEGRSGFGGAILVSDGTTQWDYHLNEGVYTLRPASATDPQTGRPIPPEEMTVRITARFLVDQIAHRADAVKSAAFLPDETINVGGKNVKCYVVRYSDDNFRTRQNNLKLEWTLWIDKSSRTVVKTSSKGLTSSVTGSAARTPKSVETTVTYFVVELDQQEPASSFSFVAPADAKLVAEFPNMLTGGAQPDTANLVGRPAPELSLKSLDGKVTALSSLRGKPVFLDFWATWCLACIDQEPELKALYAETRKGGLAWIGIDGGDDQSEAATFVSREHIPWPNYHDADGSFGKALHRGPIPLGVLVDADGKITFYKAGYGVADLRSAIAKLGPEFSSVASTAANSTGANLK